MGVKHTRQITDRQVRRAVGEHVAINVLELSRFLRRGFWGRLAWLLFGR